MRDVALVAVVALVQGVGAGLAAGPAAGVLFGLTGGAAALLLVRPDLLDETDVDVDWPTARRFLAVAVVGGSIGFGTAGLATLL